MCCNVQPLGVTDNASFIVDIDAVSFEDLNLMIWAVGGLLVHKKCISAFLTLERFEYVKQTLRITLSTIH